MIVALAVPVRISLNAAVTPFVGYAEARIRFLCFGVRYGARARLLGGTPPHVDILTRDGTTRTRLALTGGKRQKSRWTRALFAALEFRRVEAAWILGVAEAPAATAQLCGALANALTGAAGLLLPEAEARIRVIPAFAKDACRVDLEGIVCVRLGKLIQCRLAMRGE